MGPDIFLVKPNKGILETNCTQIIEVRLREDSILRLARFMVEAAEIDQDHCCADSSVPDSFFKELSKDRIQKVILQVKPTKKEGTPGALEPIEGSAISNLNNEGTQQIKEGDAFGVVLRPTKRHWLVLVVSRESETKDGAKGRKSM